MAAVPYPDAQTIRLVQATLNTHRLAHLYLVVPPAEAHRLAQRFELHYPPAHASWLKMAELESGIFERGCLQRRAPNVETLQHRLAAREAERNAAQATLHWRFPTTQARAKLARLSPKLDKVMP